jgi:hypothetical protein
MAYADGGGSSAEEAEMRGSVQAATAIGIGYMLGRRRKLRTAALMAAATAVGGNRVGALVLERGMKMLGSTEVFGKMAPQLGDIADTVRGDLMDVGKAAVTAAVSNQIDSLTSSLHERAEMIRNPGETVAAGAGEAKEAAGTAGRAASSGGRRAASTATGAARRATGRGRPGARDEDISDEDERDEDRDEDYDEDYEADDRGEPDDYDEGEAADYDEPDEDETSEPDDGGVRGRRPAPARRGASQRRSPVSRARR